MNLEDLIHPQDSKLTYIKAHPCSTLDALLCEFASYSSCEGKNPQRWTEAFPGQLCQSRKDYMRSQGSPETTGGLLCIFFWRQMFILVECLLSNETNLVSTTKPLKPFFPLINVFSGAVGKAEGVCKAPPRAQAGVR